MLCFALWPQLNTLCDGGGLGAAATQCRQARQRVLHAGAGATYRCCLKDEALRPLTLLLLLLLLARPAARIPRVGSRRMAHQWPNPHA